MTSGSRAPTAQGLRRAKNDDMVFEQQRFLDAISSNTSSVNLSSWDIGRSTEMTSKLVEAIGGTGSVDKHSMGSAGDDLGSPEYIGRVLRPSSATAIKESKTLSFDHVLTLELGNTGLVRLHLTCVDPFK